MLQFFSALWFRFLSLSLLHLKKDFHTKRFTRYFQKSLLLPLLFLCFSAKLSNLNYTSYLFFPTAIHLPRWRRRKCMRRGDKNYCYLHKVLVFMDLPAKVFEATSSVRRWEAKGPEPIQLNPQKCSPKRWRKDFFLLSMRPIEKLISQTSEKFVGAKNYLGVDWKKATTMCEDRLHNIDQLNRLHNLEGSIKAFKGELFDGSVTAVRSLTKMFMGSLWIQRTSDNLWPFR